MERAAAGPASLFPRGPNFTLDDFSNKDFIVRDFVDSLAESAVPSNRRSGNAQAPFDPKPLIRTFESTADALWQARLEPIMLTQSLRCPRSTRFLGS